MMQNDILDSLEDLGYQGPLLSEDEFEAAIEGGSKSVEYTKVVEWLATDLCAFCKIKDAVHAIQSADDSDNFLLELSGCLREFGCPYQDLVDGPLQKRLASRQNKLQLLDYLATELQAVRLTAIYQPSVFSNTMEVEESPATMNENEKAASLKLICINLGLPKPPANITAFQLFSKIEGKIKELISKHPIDKPLLKARLSEKQWDKIMSMNTMLTVEYTIRREMLLKRLDVTVKSFMWSDKAKKNENKIASVYQPIRRQLTSKPKIIEADVLAAREDLTRLEKTSSGAAREKTKCAINKVLMGRVPDRGGRVFEMAPPPPEMPSFKQRQAAPQGQRPQSSRGGGRVQGSWQSGGDSSTQPQSAKGGWQKGGGGYNQTGEHHQGSYDQSGQYGGQRGQRGGSRGRGSRGQRY